jgi:hypothetical protein
VEAHSLGGDFGQTVSVLMPLILQSFWVLGFGFWVLGFGFWAKDITV